MKTLSPLSALALAITLAPFAAQAQNSVAPPSSPAERPVEALMAKEEAFQATNALRMQKVGVREFLRRLEGSRQKYLSVKSDLQDERVSAFIKNRSTVAATKDVANLLGGTWAAIPSPERAEGYSLLRYFHAKSCEEELWSKVRRAALDPYRKLGGLLKTSAEEYRKQEAELRREGKEPDDPLLRNGNLFYLRYAPSRAAIALLDTLPDEALFEGLKSRRLFLPARAMTETQKRLTLELAKHAGKSLEPEPEGDAASVATRADEIGQFARGFGVFFFFPLNPLKASLPRFGLGFGGMQLAGANMGEERDVALDLLPVRGSPYARPISRRSPKYPELESVVFPEAIDSSRWKNATWDEALASLSAHLDFPLYSDSYSYLLMPQDRGDLPMPDLAKKPLPEALDALCERYHYLWWFQDGALLFRSRTWFLERLYEVPFATLALLEKQLKAKGTLDAEAIAALSELTPLQLEGLGVMALSATGELQSAATGSRDSYRRLRSGANSSYHVYSYLRLFKTLSEKQKQEAMSAGGLSFESLSPAQQRTLSFTLMELQGSETGYQPKGVFFRVEASPLDAPPSKTEGGEQEGSLQGLLGTKVKIQALERSHLSLQTTLTIAFKQKETSQNATRRKTQEP